MTESAPPPQPAAPVPARPRRGLAAALAILLAALLHAAITLLAGEALRGSRADLTADRLYSPHPLTEAVLTAIDEPIVLDLVHSRRLAAQVPELAAHAAWVRDRLADMVERADGGLILRERDPAPTDAEADAAHGLLGLPLGGEDRLFFGLIGRNSVDDVETVPFFAPEQAADLDYELTRLIHRLATPARATLGLLGRLPLVEPSGDLSSFVIAARLEAAFDLLPLAPETTTIPDRVGALLLVHPRDLPDATQYAIDQFLMAGGRAVVLIDPHSEAEARRRPPEELFSPTYSSLGRFAESWGVTMDVEQVAGDIRAALRVNTGTADRPDMVDYVVWLRLGPDNVAAEDRIAGGLDRITLASAGILEPLPGATTRFAPLLWTSRLSQPLDVARASFNPNPRQLLAEFVPGDRPLTLAARIAGPAASAFPDGPPPGWIGSAPHMPETREPLDLVLIADTDLLEDRFWVEIDRRDGEALAIPFADNDLLLINAVEALTGTLDLTPLRGRSSGTRPFTGLAEWDERARHGLMVATLAAGPLLALLAMVGIALARRAARRRPWRREN